MTKLIMGLLGVDWEEATLILWTAPVVFAITCFVAWWHS